MIRKIFLIFLLQLLLPSFVYVQTIEYTKREKNEVRQGPGNYFPMIYILPKGASVEIIESKEGWLQFKLQQEALLTKELQEESKKMQTWISKNCLIDKAPDMSRDNLAVKWESVKASQASVAAAIRGFALRYGKASVASLDSLIRLRNSLFTPQEYYAFREETMRNVRPTSSRNLVANYTSYFADCDIQLDEEGIGLGIASQIAANGLVNDWKLQKYVNLLTTYLAEASGAYDTPFRTFVLDDPELKTFSIPGGFIFITSGIINLCSDESELAAILSHEMMNIILKHGLREMKKRPVQQKMDLAMKELEQETGEGKDSTELELEQFALEAYENVMKPRIQSYEEESDCGAIFLLVQEGYDPMAVPRMVLNIKNALQENLEFEMENPFVHLDFQKRYEQNMNFIKANFPGIKGAKNIARFEMNVKKY